jgi:hypothetical protein
MDMQRRQLAMTLAASAGLLAAAAAGTASAAGPHPHIHIALDALRAARQELVTAATDFGGHRVDALAAVDAAIAQLNVCLQY